MTTPAERYLAHLDEISGGLEPEFQPIETTSDLPRVTTIIYRDVPEPGHITGMTYGLSLADHEDWRLGKPELCVSVASTDISWPLAAAYLAESLRGECPFSYGNVIDFGEISPESAMTAFVVFAPAVLDPEYYQDIDVGGPTKINIAGVYPIHASEGEFIQEHGLEEFWHLDWDPYDVTRPPAV
jgi:suppressor of fused protein SUFU